MSGDEARTFLSDGTRTAKLATVRPDGRALREDQAEVFGRRNAVEGELLVRVRPSKIIARADIAGWD